MHTISLDPVADFDAVAARWQALEPACDGGFFRSWRFLGCLVRQRFTSPFLLSVRQDGQDIALGLFNRAGGRLHLGRTGNATLDSLFIEHNGLLTRRAAAWAITPALTLAASVAPVVLAGIGDGHLQAAEKAGLLISHESHFAPALALDALQAPYLTTLSANARAQIRRAMRLYGASLTLRRAGDPEQALAWFARLVQLHQLHWTGRQKPGAFAEPEVLDFHHCLISGGVPEGSVDVLGITAGGAEIGYLYNFCHGGRVLCYQSGLVAAQDARLKPGLVCHALAVEHYRAAGAATYDMLAGAARYKTTLAPEGGEILHWATLYPANSWEGRARKLARRALAVARVK